MRKVGQNLATKRLLRALSVPSSLVKYFNPDPPLSWVNIRTPVKAPNFSRSVRSVKSFVMLRYHLSEEVKIFLPRFSFPLSIVRGKKVWIFVLYSVLRSTEIRCECEKIQKYYMGKFTVTTCLKYSRPVLNFGVVSQYCYDTFWKNFCPKFEELSGPRSAPDNILKWKRYSHIHVALYLD